MCNVNDRILEVNLESIEIWSGLPLNMNGRYTEYVRTIHEALQLKESSSICKIEK